MKRFIITLASVLLLVSSAFGAAGDVNNDGFVDLKDVIAALQGCAGLTPTSATTGSVDGDSKIGMQEAIFVLQVVAQLRTRTIWYKDTDGDGYSDSNSLLSYGRPYPDFYKESEVIATSGDLNDNDSKIFPTGGMTEITRIQTSIQTTGANWVAESNAISALPREERKKRLGLKLTDNIPASAKRTLVTRDNLPSSFDWRNNSGNFVTPIKDQGGCGSCWAFATTAALESHILIKTNQTKDLSEQVVMSCSGAMIDCTNGGYINEASDFIRDVGTSTENCYPYTETEGNCGGACSAWQNNASKIDGWDWIDNTVTNLKNAIYQHGPVVSSLDVYSDFFSYKSGVYKYSWGKLEGGHAIVIVGWDDANSCFIVKNSWNTGWGESGYFRIAYSEIEGTTKFGLETIAYKSQSSQSQWQQTNGPSVIKEIVTTFAITPDGSKVFAGIFDKGVFLSINNGVSWTAVNNGLTNLKIASLAISGSNIFAGTIDGGIFLSTNNGASWTTVNNGLTNTSVRTIAINGSNIFAGTLGGGIFLSSNNGSTWTQVNNGLENLSVNSIVVSGSNIFAGTYVGVYLSTDNGATWTGINNGFPCGMWSPCSPPPGIEALAVSGTNIFAGTGASIFLSANGARWTELSIIPSYPTVNSIAISGSNIFAGTDKGVYLSSDNGTTWTNRTGGMTMSIAVNGSNIFAGSTGVLLSTNNGASWSFVNNGLPSPSVYTSIKSLAVSGTGIFAGTDGNGTFLSSDNGSIWTSVNNGLTDFYVNALAVKEGYRLFAATKTGVFSSADNGSNWIPVNKGLLPSSTTSLLSVNAVFTSGVYIFAGTAESSFGVSGGRVLLSTDNGANWTPASTGLSPVYALMMNGSKLFAGTGRGVYSSTDYGANWTFSSTGVTDKINSLVMGNSKIFAGTEKGVLVTSDNGATWTSANNGLTNTDVLTLAISGSYLFAGTNGGGVFLSTNNGTSWTSLSNGLASNAVVYSFTIKGSDLFAGIKDGGVWNLTGAVQ